MNKLSDFDKSVMNNTRKFGNFAKNNPWIKWVIIGGLGFITLVAPFLGLFLLTLLGVAAAIVWNTMKKI